MNSSNEKSPTIKVFIADDHEIVKEGLKSLIDLTPDLKVCGFAGTGRNLAQKIENAGCDVLVLDINMPELNSLEFVRRLAQKPDSPGIIIFTMHKEDSHALNYLRAGALSFINKRRSTAQLLEAIKVVAAKKRYLTDDISEYLFEHQISIDEFPHESLSSREREVFNLLIASESTEEIAKTLAVTTSTVNTFIQRIKQKLGVNSIVEIVQYARDNSLT